MNFEKPQNQENNKEHILEKYKLAEIEEQIKEREKEHEEQEFDYYRDEDDDYYKLVEKANELKGKLGVGKLTKEEELLAVGELMSQRLKVMEEEGINFYYGDEEYNKLEEKWNKLHKELEGSERSKKKETSQEQGLAEETFNQESQKPAEDIVKKEPQTTLSDFETSKQDSPLVEIKGSTEKTPEEDTEKQEFVNELKDVLEKVNQEEDIPFKEQCLVIEKQMREIREERGEDHLLSLFNDPEYAKLNVERIKTIKEHVDSLSITNEAELESFLAEMQEFPLNTQYFALDHLSSKRKKLGLEEDLISQRLEQEMQRMVEVRLNNAEQTNETEKEKLSEQKQALFEKLKASFQDEEKLKKALIFGIAVGAGLIIPIASMTAFGGGLFGVGAGLSVKALGISPTLSMGIGGPIGTMLSFAVTKKIANIGIAWSEKRKTDQDLLSLFKDKLEIESPFPQEGFNQLNDEQKQALNNILIKEEKEKVIEYIKENLPEFFDSLKL
ncbi:MAG: hypothetical protein WC157_01815 [Candidatus Paceibacterota bacterium]